MQESDIGTFFQFYSSLDEVDTGHTLLNTCEYLYQHQSRAKSSLDITWQYKLFNNDIILNDAVAP